VLIDEGLEILDEAEAFRLLAGSEVGRVGVTIGALPAIFPVNYRVVDGSVVFWSAPGSKLSAAAAGAVVAFEVDDYNVADRTGWSVLVVGPSEVVEDRDVAFKALAAGLAPFVDGFRRAIIRIEPTFVSGRRIVHEPTGDGSRSW
jgi:nitroimidazol reductase NimA-like FMN-containing flavoprotein (pyridoxamine 5'-phosphate oxidase superfamily)